MLKSPLMLRHITAGFIAKNIYTKWGIRLTRHHRHRCMSPKILFLVFSKILKLNIPTVLKKKISYLVYKFFENYFRYHYRIIDRNFYNFLYGEGNRKRIRDMYIYRLGNRKVIKSCKFLNHIDIYYFY